MNNPARNNVVQASDLQCANAGNVAQASSLQCANADNVAQASSLQRANAGNVAQASDLQCANADNVAQASSLQGPDRHTEAAPEDPGTAGAQTGETKSRQDACATRSPQSTQDACATRGPQSRQDACATPIQQRHRGARPIQGQEDGPSDSGSLDSLPDALPQRPKLLSGTHDRGYLPHWKDAGATYFVTFRLAGTLPKTLLDKFEAERNELVTRARRSGTKPSHAEEQKLRELPSRKIDEYIDAGHGECRLAHADIAKLVSGALRHFAGKRYDLHAWVLMPNHVHVVLTPLGNHSLSAILHSWKSYTATKANEILDRRGQSFWQRESYDHLIRDEDEFFRHCEYTIQNPVSAGLCRRPEDWPHSSAARPKSSA
jgi:putative transposase